MVRILSHKFTWLLLLGVSSSLMFGCRGKSKVSVRDSGTATEETEDDGEEHSGEKPVDETKPDTSTVVQTEIPGALTSATQKEYFQPGEQITISVGAELYDGASTITVINETTGNTIYLTEDLATFEIVSTVDGDVLVINVSSQYAGNGTNVFKIVATDPDGSERVGYINIQLTAFAIFGIAGSGFDTNVQSSGGLQGWVNPMITPVVVDSTTGTMLIGGWSNIINY